MPPTTGVPVELDRRRTLRYNRPAIYMLEDRTGQTTVELFGRLKAGSYKAMVDLVWAGLLHEDRTLEPVDVAELVGFDDIEDVAEAVNDALLPMFPGAEGEDEGDAADPKSDDGASE